MDKVYAYLTYLEANGYNNLMSPKMFGLGLLMMYKEYGLSYEKLNTKPGTQTNIELNDESYYDWLHKSDKTPAL